MGFKYRWKPSASQKREYHERMVAIEESKDKDIQAGYDINCTGDCCVGDTIRFFNAAKGSEPFYGNIISESYGEAKQQHTFIIETVTGRIFIKGRNLYKNGVLRRAWEDENERKAVLEKKHSRGSIAREEAQARKAKKYRDVENEEY